MRALLAIAVLITSLLQVAVVPAFVFQPAAAPLLPLAVCAAWGILRGVEEVWPSLPVAAVTLGLGSSEGAGWLLLAMLPAAGCLFLVRFDTAASRGAVHAAISAAAGCFGYSTILVVAAGRWSLLPQSIEAIAVAATNTAALAVVAVLALRSLRSLRAQPRGLFG